MRATHSITESGRAFFFELGDLRMGKPNRATQEKRNRERSQKERQQEKVDQRVLRKDTRADRASSLEQGIDPDLIGIFPGPQPDPEDQ